MKNLIRPSGWVSALIVGLSLGACSPQAASNSTSTPATGIVGGTTVDHLSSLSSRLVFIVMHDEITNDYHSCTGALLPGNIVLTAAHCVPGKGSTIVVGFGAKVALTEDIMTNPNMHQVTARRRQPAYKPGDTPAAQDLMFGNDVGLLKFAGSAPSTATTFALPFGEEQRPGDGDSMYMIGYGFSSATTADAGVLRFLKLPVSKVLNMASDEAFIAVDAKDSGACMGDSGSPLAFYQGNTPVIWGVTSANKAGADDPSNPCKGTDYFTRVSAQSTWLQSNYNDLVSGN